MSDYLVTKDDCQRVADGLVEILGRWSLASQCSFLVYGCSSLGSWRDGLSDLDGIIYLEEGSLCDKLTIPVIHKIQSEIVTLQRKLPFLEASNFFADIFVMDEVQGHDGRFIVHDAYSFEVFFTPNRYRVLCGRDFLGDLKPVSLRNQDELYLAFGLQKIRNYLIFEAPRPAPKVSSESTYETLKFLRVLPRIVSKILEEPIDPLNEALDIIARRFPEINYWPLYRMLETSKDFNQLQQFLESWHQPQSTSLINCWLCYELTLTALIRRFSMKSLR